MKTRAFDHVAIGGGAAGCVIAARLAARGTGTVALIERGRRDTDRWIHIPGTFFKALQGRYADVVISGPDPSLGGLLFGVPQGRLLVGGSSVQRHAV